MNKHCYLYKKFITYQRNLNTMRYNVYSFIKQNNITSTYSYFKGITVNNFVQCLWQIKLLVEYKMDLFIILIVILTILVNILLGLTDNSTKFENASKLFKKSTENSTSCEELLLNYKFDPLPLMDLDWKTFYYWNYEKEPIHIFRFSPPYPVVCKIFLLFNTNVNRVYLK